MVRATQDIPVGQSALIARLGLQVPDPAVKSVVGPGARRTTVINGRTLEKYTQVYAPEDSLVGHLKFALRYEPLELGILSAAFRAAGPQELERWARSEPTGTYARRAWFLYEWLTGKTLDLPDAGLVAYTAALDAKLHITATGLPSRRHKVTDNILGVPGFAPTVRRTKRIEEFQAEAINREAQLLIAGCDQDVLRRAVSYLYTKETKSSFAIENEVATGQRAERFIAALRSFDSFDATQSGSLVALQNTIVDPRYAAVAYRDFQNFVGETVGGHREVVHFICPRPQDVALLMAGWADMTARLKGATDPVVAAALVSFAFVFIHPFEDGNGRIHRFLMHYILAREGFTPPDILFPISAAIVRDRKGYDAALETFSKAIQPHIDWNWTPASGIEVASESGDLYRYFDATELAEFLYAKVGETVRKDLKEELDFVGIYDAALEAVRERIDMPDRRASLLVRLLLQNQGVLSKSKRTEFAEITDNEVVALQVAIQKLFAERELKADWPA